MATFVNEFVAQKNFQKSPDLVILEKEREDHFRLLKYLFIFDWKALQQCDQILRKSPLRQNVKSLWQLFEG